MIPAAALALAAGAFAAGSLLSRSRLASHEVEIAAPPEAVYPLLWDLKGGWAQWNPLLAGPANLSLEFGTETAGEGAAVAWRGRAGAGSLRLTACAPPRSLTYETTSSLGNLSARGTIELLPAPSGTRVVWKDELAVGRNPAARWLALAMDGMRKRQLRAGLSALKQACEKAALPSGE